MFKFYPLILVFLILFSCKEDATALVCEEYPYRAKLVIKGICFNYVVEFIDAGPNSNLVDSQWTDEMTGKVYNNAFRLSNYCDFPAEIQEGDEFFFSLGANTS